MVKEIRFSDHSQLKINLLGERGIVILNDFVMEVIRSPDKVEPEGEGKITAQKQLNETLVLRVVYREYDTFIFVITVYPGKRSRYEKNSI